MSTKSKNVASTKENTASAITEGVIAQAEKITDFSALVIERVKGLKTISLKIENLSGIEALNKLSAGNIGEIVNLMQESFTDEKISRLLKLAMDFLSDSLAKSVKVSNESGKSRSCRLDLKDDSSAPALAYKAMIDMQGVIIKRNSAFKKITLAIA